MNDMASKEFIRQELRALLEEIEKPADKAPSKKPASK
jgi:hypothetical protein